MGSILGVCMFMPSAFVPLSTIIIKNLLLGRSVGPVYVRRTRRDAVQPGTAGTYGGGAEKLCGGYDFSNRYSHHSGDFKKERVSRGATYHLDS